MLKPKFIISFPVYFICLYLIISIFSCNKENPITPPPVASILDSNYLDWSFDTTYVNPSSNMFIADTDKIFIPGVPYLVYINNSSIRYISYNDNDFGGGCITGTGINNIYVGGISISLSRSKLKRWNGSGFEDIAIPVDTGYLKDIEAISENDIWMTTSKSIIYHYSNHSITTYRPDSTLSNIRLFKDNFNNLFAIFNKISYGDYLYYNISKFENNSWVQILIDSANRNAGIGYFIGFSENKILRNNVSSIDYFNGTNWEIYINLNDNIRPFIAGGGSTENILFQADENDNDYIFYFDGKKFYRHKNISFPDIMIADIQYKFGRYYMTMEEDFLGRSFLGIGKFRRNNFINSNPIKEKK